MRWPNDSRHTKLFICALLTNSISEYAVPPIVCVVVECYCWRAPVLLSLLIPFAQRNWTLLSLADAQQTIRSNLSCSYHLFVALKNRFYWKIIIEILCFDIQFQCILSLYFFHQRTTVRILFQRCVLQFLLLFIYSNRSE